MTDNKKDNELDKLISESMKLTDSPSPWLDNTLKANLYKYEKAMKSKKAHALSLWFVPMILNFIVFSIFTILALMTISNPYLAKLIASVCVYINFTGFIITIVGVKRANLKESITIHIEKRGILT